MLKEAIEAIQEMAEAAPVNLLPEFVMPKTEDVISGLEQIDVARKVIRWMRTNDLITSKDSHMINARQIEYPPETKVRVWLGAWTGTPGTPPLNPQTIECIIDHWNSVGQAYVRKLHNVDPLAAAGNVSMYVFGPAILGRA